MAVVAPGRDMGPQFVKAAVTPVRARGLTLVTTRQLDMTCNVGSPAVLDLALMSKTTSSPPAPDPIAIVAIPARNEEACLPACLDALAAQRGGIPFAVVVFANNCEDRTVAMACGMQPRLPFRLLVEEVSLPEGCRTAGHARRGAMDLASRIAGEAYKQR